MSALLSAIAACAAEDVAAMSAPAQLQRLEELFAAERRLQAEISRSLQIARAKDVTVQETGLQPRSWLIEEMALAPGDAARRDALARDLAALPVVADTWAAGDIGEAHARMLAKALLHLPESRRQEAQAALVPFATGATTAQLQQAITESRREFGSAAADGRDRLHAQRYLRAAKTCDGEVSVSGVLDPIAGEALLHVLAAGRADSGADDARTVWQRDADTLAAMTSHWLACSGLPDNGGERPRLVLTIDYWQLAAAVDAADVATAELGPVPAATLRRVACDAEILPAVMGSRSQVLDLGRTTRMWSVAQRRAITLRDGVRCGYGGCHNRPAELHHVMWWSHGGRTDVDNGVWLCAFHHWLVHEGGWSLTRDAATNTVTFVDRNGRRHRFRRGRSVTGGAPLPETSPTESLAGA